MNELKADGYTIFVSSLGGSSITATSSYELIPTHFVWWLACFARASLSGAAQ